MSFEIWDLNFLAWRWCLEDLRGRKWCCRCKMSCLGGSHRNPVLSESGDETQYDAHVGLVYIVLRNRNRGGKNNIPSRILFLVALIHIISRTKLWSSLTPVSPKLFTAGPEWRVSSQIGISCSLRLPFQVASKSALKKKNGSHVHVAVKLDPGNVSIKSIAIYWAHLMANSERPSEFDTVFTGVLNTYTDTLACEYIHCTCIVLK